MFQKKKIMLQEQDSLWPHLMNISDGGKKINHLPLLIETYHWV